MHVQAHHPQTAQLRVTRPSAATFVTPAGVTIARGVRPLVYGGAQLAQRLGELRRALDTRPGALLSSQFSYPNRYTRWDKGFVDPPVSISGRGLCFEVRAEHERGRAVLAAMATALSALRPQCEAFHVDAGRIAGTLAPDADSRRTEEARTRRPTLLTVVRTVVQALSLPDDEHLGLMGAFGYDLVFQLEDLQRTKPRTDQRDLVLYLPDQLLVVDHERQDAFELSYTFGAEAYQPRSVPAMPAGMTAAAPTDKPTVALDAEEDHAPAATVPADDASPHSEFAEGEFEALVEHARGAFLRGDLFEVTPGQRFSMKCTAPPSRLFESLSRDNPAPYGFLINLGPDGHLVGASPEMFVRVRGKRIETCPIAGTIARGTDAMSDADQVLRLLSSSKDEAELTMCTDVDRNDKARVCKPGSVRILGRRQIEKYSRLIHTVDHLEGELREDFDALDALATHCWAVTVTGAPKLDAMQFIEDHERSPRGFYGGAVGMVGLDGALNTGLTLRTIHLQDGVACVRAGATLLHASDPKEEAAECHLKASALLAAIRTANAEQLAASPVAARHPPAGRGTHRGRLLLIDHRDSFVHTLADYFRQLGMEVTTVRSGAHAPHLEDDPDSLVVLSPGPGRPSDFDLTKVLNGCATTGRPVFGVCLGMQAMVEHAGGQLEVLRTPQHGRASAIQVRGGNLFAGLPNRGLRVGRYHSLYATPSGMPEDLEVLAVSEDDGCVMACRHRALPFMGVQFHPESILSARDNQGLQLLDNALRELL